jgi:hypothetical protein
MTDETTKDPEEWYLNPHSNRYCRVGGKLHTRLIKELNAKKPEPVPRGNIKLEPVNTADVLQHRLMEESTEMIQENIHALGDVENLSQKELDRLLKRMLIDKLGLSEKPRKKRKKKKKKKPRFKVKTPPSSSSEESDSSD